jgi:osmotically-inducible protein OsmY
MKHSAFVFASVAAVGLSPCLGGCAGVAIVGGMAAASGAGYTAGQERGFIGTVDDMSIKSGVSNALNSQYGDVTATVYQGRVLLTGSSPTMASKSDAERVASRVPGVTTVYNEIAVGPAEDPVEAAKDTWITARVRSDLVFDADIRSPNYTIATERQSVYLMGSARSQGELERATQVARYVPGVQRVVSYVEVRPGTPYAAAPPGPSQAEIAPPASPYVASSPYAARPSPYLPQSGGGALTPSAPSNAPIQVQKL